MPRLLDQVREMIRYRHDSQAQFAIISARIKKVEPGKRTRRPPSRLCILLTAENVDGQR